MGIEAHGLRIHGDDGAEAEIGGKVAAMEPDVHGD